MRCPVCNDELEVGNHRCSCGGFLLHPWHGGAALIGAQGTWVWRTEPGSWERIESKSRTQVVQRQDKPVSVTPVAGTSMETSITVTDTGQGSEG